MLLRYVGFGFAWHHENIPFTQASIAMKEATSRILARTPTARLPQFHPIIILDESLGHSRGDYVSIVEALFGRHFRDVIVP